LRNFASLAVKRAQNRASCEIVRNFSQLSIQPAKPLNLTGKVNTSILNTPGLLALANPTATQVRTVTRFSYKLGKRKSVKCVKKRFYRLDWGIWIRTRTARHKRLWKKSQNKRRKLRQHVFVNSTQSWMLDKMMTTFWRRPKHHVDDPYAPYHKREGFWSTRKKPIDWEY
jgi:large subunit ribosomal protein L35